MNEPHFREWLPTTGLRLLYLGDLSIEKTDQFLEITFPPNFFLRVLCFCVPLRR